MADDAHAILVEDLYHTPGYQPRTFDYSTEPDEWPDIESVLDRWGWP